MTSNMPFRRSKDALLYQRHVYQYARRVVVGNGAKTILDIGCGNPQKLKAFILPFTDEITGVDLPEIVDAIDVDFGTWIGCDLNTNRLRLRRKYDLIIAADVIEHLKSPKCLIRVIKDHANKKTVIVISTPEKRSVKVRNASHHREYERDELVNILKASGLDVINVKSVIEEQTKYPYVSNMFICFSRAGA